MRMKFFIASMFFITSGLFWSTLVPQAEAGVGESASGFAWGGGAATNGAGYEGIGWISFNNTSDGSATNYGVNIPSSGALSGYAWSEHYGWISFNGADLASCAPVLTQATRTGNAIAGGARILAVRDGMLAGNAGGFDGCISLSGAGYGVTVVGNALSGYAWSSDLGWINFTGVIISVPQTLKICRNSCTSAIRLDTGALASFNMNAGATDSRVLVSCQGTGSCTGDDVLVPATTWSETSSGSFSDVVDRSPTANPVSAVTITGKATGSERINVVAGGNFAQAVANVTCTVIIPSCDNNSVGAQATCNGSQYPMTYTNSCTSLPMTQQCDGKRNCDYNWKEVAP